MKKITLFLVAFVCLCSSCKDNNAKDQDQTPVSPKELDELSPDATFNDVVSIFDQVEKDPEFNSFLKLVSQAQMMDDVKSLEDVTLFAPSDAAVKEISDDTYAELRLPQNLGKLQGILKYHIVQGERDASSLLTSIQANDGKPLRLETVQGGYIALQVQDGNIVITDEDGSTSVVVNPDIEASNGVIHTVNKILIPMQKE